MSQKAQSIKILPSFFAPRGDTAVTWLAMAPITGPRPLGRSPRG